MDSEIVFDFIESINTANIDKLCKLMTGDHVFIDSRGNTINGKDNMKVAWSTYFNLFSDYKIEITDTLQKDYMVVLLGYASGTYKLNDAKIDTDNY